jgi:hypothetical protein
LKRTLSEAIHYKAVNITAFLLQNENWTGNNLLRVLLHEEGRAKIDWVLLIILKEAPLKLVEELIKQFEFLWASDKLKSFLHFIDKSILLRLTKRVGSDFGERFITSELEKLYLNKFNYFGTKRYYEQLLGKDVTFDYPQEDAPQKDYPPLFLASMLPSSESECILNGKQFQTDEIHRKFEVWRGAEMTALQFALEVYNFRVALKLLAMGAERETYAYEPDFKIQYFLKQQGLWPQPFQIQTPTLFTEHFFAREKKRALFLVKNFSYSFSLTFKIHVVRNLLYSFHDL